MCVLARVLHGSKAAGQAVSLVFLFFQIDFGPTALVTVVPCHSARGLDGGGGAGDAGVLAHFLGLFFEFWPRAARRVTARLGALGRRLPASRGRAVITGSAGQHWHSGLR